MVHTYGLSQPTALTGSSPQYKHKQDSQGIFKETISGLVYAAKISDHMLKHGKYLSIELVDLCLAVVKLLGARWMMKSLTILNRIQV